MKTFSLSFLLIGIAICGLIAALVLANFRGQEMLLELETAKTEIKFQKERGDNLLNELGRLKVVDSEKYQVRRFSPRYFRRQLQPGEIRDEQLSWRVYVPDISKCRFRIFQGKLPSHGVPEQGMLIPASALVRPKTFSSTSGEVTLVMFCKMNDKFGGTTEITFEPRLEDGSGTDETMMFGTPRDGIPWLDGKPCKTEFQKYGPDEPFDLEEPLQLFKRFFVDKTGDQFGTILWVESTN